MIASTPEFCWKIDEEKRTIFAEKRMSKKGGLQLFGNLVHVMQTRRENKVKREMEKKVGGRRSPVVQRVPDIGSLLQ